MHRQRSVRGNGVALGATSEFRDKEADLGPLRGNVLGPVSSARTLVVDMPGGAAERKSRCLVLGARAVGKTTLVDRAHVAARRDDLVSEEPLEVVPEQPSVVLVESVAELRGASAEAVTAMADESRRLIERIPAPPDVTLVFTHADSVPGFLETFGDVENKNQPFGAYRSPTDPRALAVFSRDELELLLERVRLRVLEQCRAEPASGRLQAVMSFPNELAALEANLTAYLERVFEPRSDAKPRFRGFYFTAATPAGDFFLRDLFTRVLLADGAAATERARWRRRTWRNASLFALAVACIVGATVPFVRSYIHNRALIEEWDDAVSEAGKIEWTPTPVDKTPRLDAILALLRRHEGYVRDGVPSRLGWGMYQGDRLYAPTVTFHSIWVHDHIVRGTGYVLARELSSHAGPLAADGPEYIAFHQALRLYLMLGNRYPMDSEWAGARCAQIRASYPSNEATDETLRDNTRYFLEHVTSGREAALTLDESVIARARAKLYDVPRSDREFAALVFALEDIRADEASPPGPGNQLFAGVTLDELMLDADGRGLIQSARAFETGQPAGVRGAFTPRARGAVLDRYGRRRALLAEEEVLLPATSDGEEPSGRADFGLYLGRYADAWSAFLADLRIAPPQDVEAALELYRLLGRWDTSLQRIILASVLEHTVWQAPGVDLRDASGPDPLHRFAKLERLTRPAAVRPEAETLLTRYVALVGRLARAIDEETKRRKAKGEPTMTPGEVAAMAGETRREVSALLESEQDGEVRSMLASLLLSPLAVAPSVTR